MRFSFVIAITLLTFQVSGQYLTPINDSLHSAVLNEQRRIDIMLPENYDKDTARYDVWYVPDGEWNTRTFSNIAGYLSSIGFAPRLIIVGVHNRYASNGFNYRGRDMTPLKAPDIDSSGGAETFLKFFEDELIPYIDSRYRTSRERGIFGSSLGGVFAMYCLLEKPYVFRFYTLADPAFQFAGQYINTLAEQRLAKLKISDIVLNIGGRSGTSYNLMGGDVMDSLLRKHAPEGLHWHSQRYDDETHISSVFKSNYDGLKFAYLGYSSMNILPNLTAGIVLKDRPINLFFPTDHTNIRYTTDGSVPTRRSARIEEYITVSNPDHLRVKSFSSIGKYDYDIVTNLRTGNFLSAKKLSRNVRLAGKIDKGSKIDRSGKMYGFMSAPVDGYYVFQLTPSEGTKLKLNDSTIIDGDRNNAGIRKTLILPLRKGNYPFSLYHPSRKLNDLHVDLGVYYSEDGLNNWNVLLN